MESNKMMSSSLLKSDTSALPTKLMSSTLDDGEVKKIMEECKRLQMEAQRLREENKQIRVSTRVFDWLVGSKVPGTTSIMNTVFQDCHVQFYNFHFLLNSCLIQNVLTQKNVPVDPRLCFHHPIDPAAAGIWLSRNFTSRFNFLFLWMCVEK